MFRGRPFIPTNPCLYCKGTTRIGGDFPEHECTSCNGTGIDGDPFYALVIILAFAIALIIVVIVNW